MTLKISQCSVCRHFRADIRALNSCDAFPDGIPAEIMLNQADHRQPVSNDNGVRFKAIDGKVHPSNIAPYLGKG